MTDNTINFTREEYDGFPSRQRLDAFKTFVLRRFGDYTRFTAVKGAKTWDAEPTHPIGVVEDPFKRGWGGWKVDERTLLSHDLDYFLVMEYMQDDRGPTSYYNYVKLPKAFVFGEMEQDEEYQLYLRLKARFEGE